MLILDGKKVSENIKESLKEKISNLDEEVKLAIIQVGNKSDSNIYIKRKIDFGSEIGVKVILKKFEEAVSESEVIDEIDRLNKDESIKGIIVQIPLPQNFDSRKIINKVSFEKDVDGMTDKNLKIFFSGSDDFVLPAVVRAIENLIKEYDIETYNKKVCIIGDSFYVGKNIARFFEIKESRITVCNIETKDLRETTKESDILVSAVGKLGLITDEHVNKF
jgi:methylenetetrahydrofolate dehydrogenase (NADP+)/methenyltetrahydrofolate cyclohydrolase